MNCSPALPLRFRKSRSIRPQSLRLSSHPTLCRLAAPSMRQSFDPQLKTLFAANCSSVRIDTYTIRQQQSQVWSQMKRVKSWQQLFNFHRSPLAIDDWDAWTLNASLTRLSSYRKCSKCRILDHSARATSPLQIEGTTKCSHTARGSGCGNDMASVAEPNPQCSD